MHAFCSIIRLLEKKSNSYFYTVVCICVYLSKKVMLVLPIRTCSTWKSSLREQIEDERVQLARDAKRVADKSLLFFFFSLSLFEDK